MNREQVNLVRRSFEKKSSEAFAESFYNHLFSIQPALRLLFPDDSGERNEKLMPLFEAALELPGEPEKRIPVLEETGRRRALDGIREEHYETIGVALLAALRELNGANFTAENEAAWTKFYKLISETMKRGARRLADAPDQNQEKNTEEKPMKIINQTKFTTGFIFLIFIFAVSSVAQTTVFTYQGKLNDGATAANGTYDFQFKLYDTMAVGTGNQIGSEQIRLTTTVTNGIFTVQLDFGSLPFSTGADRYLEIGVRQNQGQNYTTLAPRQALTSSPFAIRALSAETATNSINSTFANSSSSAETATNSAQLGGIAANQYVLITDSRLTDARIPLPGSGNYIQNTTDQQALSNFNISGTGNANILSATQFNIGNARILGGGFGGGVYLGFSAGQNTFGLSFFNTFVGDKAGFNNTEGEQNTFFGASAGQSNTTGMFNTVVGSFADVGANNLQYATAIGAGSVVSTSDTIVLGRASGADKVRIPGLGSGGSTSLCRNAAGQISSCSSSLRYKTNINPFSSGLSIINRLKPITFKWKDGGMLDLGLGAEEVAAVDENLVIRNAKGEVEGVKYDRLGVVLINAVKEQQAQLETQQQQLETQQKLIEEQAAQIELLKRLVCAQNPNAAVCQGIK